MATSLRIESPDNPRVKEAVRLRERRARGKTGRFLVEGRREIAQALRAGLVPGSLFVEESRLTRDAETRRLVEAAQQAGARVLLVTEAVAAKLALREGDDGLVGVFPIPDASPEKLRLSSAPLVLCAAGIEKPGNVGALLRSADAFAVDAFVVEGGTDLWNPNVVRASLGCLFSVPVAAVREGGLVSWLRAAELRVVAAAPDGARTPSEADLTGAVAILLGSEERGLDRALLSAADVVVRIPMHGRADSLNVSVSAGILLYEADRQRGGRRGTPGGAGDQSCADPSARNSSSGSSRRGSAPAPGRAARDADS
ncbi:MAG: RNA methyltransferase [bacterium]